MEEIKSDSEFMWIHCSAYANEGTCQQLLKRWITK